MLSDKMKVLIYEETNALRVQCRTCLVCIGKKGHQLTVCQAGRINRVQTLRPNIPTHKPVIGAQILICARFTYRTVKGGVLISLMSYLLARYHELSAAT